MFIFDASCPSKNYVTVKSWHYFCLFPQLCVLHNIYLPVDCSCTWGIFVNALFGFMNCNLYVDLSVNTPLFKLPYFCKRFIWERERSHSREEQRERERLKQTLHRAWRPTRGLSLRPRDYDLCRNPESNTQTAEPARQPSSMYLNLLLDILTIHNVIYLCFPFLFF